MPALFPGCKHSVHLSITGLLVDILHVRLMIRKSALIFFTSGSTVKKSVVLTVMTKAWLHCMLKDGVLKHSRFACNTKNGCEPLNFFFYIYIANP